MIFANLHGHTSFSTGDGHGSPEQHVKRAKELGMSAIALTEHGTVSSHVQLEKAAKKHGIKPIFGVEAYVAKDVKEQKFHQTLLALTPQGYKQINELVSRSYSEGFHRKPTVLFRWLEENTSDIACLSGCEASLLSRTITDPSKDFDDALDVVLWFQEVFQDRFYLEAQRFFNYDKTVETNKAIEALHWETGIPVVGTADVHYPTFDGWEINRLAHSIAWGKSLKELSEGRDYSSKPGQTFPESDKEMARDLIKAGLSKYLAVQAVKNTKVVADRCEDFDLPKSTPIRFSGSKGRRDSVKLLKTALVEGVKYRKDSDENFQKEWETKKPEYLARIKKELETIIPKGFTDYFLVNQEIISWAKNAGIAVGPARGSAAGSLVCYLLRITEINPMLYPMMLFERFLDPGREDDPDIDTDYQDTRRGEVFAYARSVYGEENVGNIGAFTRYRGRMAIKDTAKSVGVSYQDAEKYADLIGDADLGDEREFCTAEDTAKSYPDAAEILENNPDLALAFRLEGDMKTLGVHAAGMVISNNPIPETCAIYKRTKSNGEETEVIAFDKRDAAYLGMLKLDVLGLSTMTIIADCIEMIEGLTLEKLYALPFDDPAVLKAFARDDLVGIFQFEGRSTRNIVQRIFKGKDKTPTFMQLADMNALSRPGSLSSGMTGRYIKVENGAEKTLIHPVVDKILKETNGCLVYQEQVMQIGKFFGGLSDNEIGRLRKIIGAKEKGGAFDAFWEKFRDGARDLHGVEEKEAKEVWDYMAASASYLFNVAHAISYAAIAYWTMYLKVYYPAQFFAASLRKASQKTNKGGLDPQTAMLQDAVAHNVTITPPHPMLSRESWWVNESCTGVVAGFSQIEKVGMKIAKRMVEARGDETMTWASYTKLKIGFGAKAAERAEALSSSNDPFGVNLTNDVVYSVIEAIESGEAPGLDSPDVNSANISRFEGQDVVYIGHVISVRLINVIEDMRKREGLSPEEIKATIRRPDLEMKAKIICADVTGGEVHVNISRYTYPNVIADIKELSRPGIWVVYAYGKASSEYGAAIQANSITAIEMEK